MNQLRKAFVMLAAAMTMTAVGTGAAAASKTEKGKPPPDKDQVGKDGEAKGKKRVVKVRKARRRPADFDGDFGMPAGTAYDVIRADDI